ncbi:MAG: hypothetical protein ACJ73U_47255, partial [Actinophytocola sp.]
MPHRGELARVAPTGLVVARHRSATADSVVADQAPAAATLPQMGWGQVVAESGGTPERGAVLGRRGSPGPGVV